MDLKIFNKIILHPLLKHRLLFGIIIPVMGAGLVFSFILNTLFLPPIVVNLKNMNNSMIINSLAMEISFCEDKFAYLLDLRMEENKAMNTALKKEALARINAISPRFPKVRMMIVDKTGKILATTFKSLSRKINIIEFKKNLNPEFNGNKIIQLSLFKDKVMADSQYFPFWQWTIISFIPEKDYMSPIIAAKKTVRLGTFGTVTITAFVLLLLFLMKINTPLKKIIKATDDVSRGKFNPINVKGYNEISDLSRAFNSMIENLENNQKKIDMILHDLKESEEQYRNLSENSIAVIAILQKGRFVYTNKAMTDLLHYSFDELKNMNFRDIVRSEDFINNYEKMIRLEQGKSEREYCISCFRTKTGESVFFEILASSILFKGIRSILIHAIDITEKKKSEKEQKKLEEKLVRAEKMELVGTVAGGVAHDLNNILSGVVSYPELLLMDMEKDNPLYKPLVIMQKSGIKAAAIVQDMLALTRRGVVVKEMVDLNTIVNDYLESPEFKKLEFFHPHVNVEFYPAPHPVIIKGSSVHLSKIIMNLVGNAAEAIPHGGIICIKIENLYSDGSLKMSADIERGHDLKQGDYAVLSVSDTGTGISPEDMDKIFEPFYTKKKMGRSGTGLGMSVVYGTVKDHEGYIDVKSTEKKGTCFTLYFPMAEQDNDKMSCENIPFSFEKCRGCGEKILVVDDEKNQRIIASEMLKKLGYAVKTASDGEEAVEYIKEHTIDLVMLDMIMDPGIDGLETYKRILEIHPGQRGIIASGFSETDRVKEAEYIGIAAYIKKPYVFEQIAVVIKKALNK